MAKKENFRSLTLEEQIQKRQELETKLRKSRFSVVMGKAENPMERRVIRRSIARLNTLIHEKRMSVS